MRFHQYIFCIITVLTCCLQAAPLKVAAKDPVDVTLVSTVKGTGKTEPLTVGLRFHLESGWKVYAPPPENDTAPLFGQSPEVDWSQSNNLEDVEILWPPGEWDGEGAYRVYVYNKSLIIPIKVKLVDETKSLMLKATVRYFACAQTCRPFEQDVTLTLSPQEASPTSDAAEIHTYEAYAQDFERKKDLEETASIAFMILIALLGGFILNFMPCVLPVLSLKIIGLVKHHHPRFKLKFLITAVGIIFSFLILGGIIIGFKEAGVLLGWGFHFQQPLFLGFMMIVMILFALNLYGFFEVPLPSFLVKGLSHHGRGLAREFFSGMIATLLATPCSAPFVGTTISFALSQGMLEILLLFLAMGIGFASPYVLAILLPEKWIKLPKPGKWMWYLQKILATILLLTGFWLGSVLIYQLASPYGISKVTRDNGVVWIPFDESKIQTFVSQGKTVFVDITAQWCVTCHVNKVVAFNDAAVSEILKNPSIVAMRGDWTQSNPLIATYLAKHNRYGIPFNAIYSPQYPKGIVLPELLTAKDILLSFKKVGINKRN